MRRKTFFACVLVLAVGRAGAAPAGPVVNGDFEVAAPGKEAVCVAAGPDTYVDILPSQNPWLARVHPCEAGALKAAQWSSATVTQFGDIDGDGDREARIDGSIPPSPGFGSSHNFWQAYPNAQQAYSANFEALRFRVESGAIPPGAFVQLSLSTSPREEPSPFVGVFLNCQLTFSSLLTGADGVVSVDPVDADFRSRHVDCDVAEAAWNGGDEAERRRVLGRLRIVQLSFWGFESGEPVVLDTVALTGGRTVAEEATGLTV